MKKFSLIVLAVLLTVFISLSGCGTITYDKGTGEQHPGHPGHEKH